MYQFRWKNISDLKLLYGVTGVASTPASHNLFNIDQFSNLLDSTKLNEFHSRAMKLMWLAKRVVPEILFAVSFLSTRILNATESDWSKLIRI